MERPAYHIYCYRHRAKPMPKTCVVCKELAVEKRRRFGSPLLLTLWAKHFWRSITSESGYRIVIGIVVTLVGAYFGLYAIMEARHERHLNRALFERSMFMTMVVTGPSGFRSAMDQVAQIQNRKAPIEPELSRLPWQWFGEYMPNREPLRQWTASFMDRCEPKTCGWHIGMVVPRDTGADLRIELYNANLESADLECVNLGHASLGVANLKDANLKDANLWGASLAGANLEDTNLDGALLRWTNLQDAKNVTAEQLALACVEETTKLPAGISLPQIPTEACKRWKWGDNGRIHVVECESPEKSPETNTADASR